VVSSAEKMYNNNSNIQYSSLPLSTETPSYSSPYPAVDVYTPSLTPVYAPSLIPSYAPSMPQSHAPSMPPSYASAMLPPSYAPSMPPPSYTPSLIPTYSPYSNSSTSPATKTPQPSNSSQTPSGTSEGESLCKCTRCKKYIKRDDLKTACRYHSGKYTGPSIPLGMNIGVTSIWTCCRSSDPEAPGCVHKPEHQEDANTSYILDKYFPIVKQPETSQPQQNQQQKQPQKPTQPQSLPPPPGVLPPPYTHYVIHEIKSSETISGIALKYNTKVHDIKRINNMMSDNFGIKTHLYIPQI